MKYKVGPVNVLNIRDGVLHYKWGLIKLNSILIAFLLILYGYGCLIGPTSTNLSKYYLVLNYIIILGIIFLILGNLYFIFFTLSKLAYWHFEITPRGLIYYSKDKKVKSVNYDKILSINFVKKTKLEANNMEEFKVKLYGIVKYTDKMYVSLILLGPKRSIEAMQICNDFKQYLPENKIIIDSHS